MARQRTTTKAQDFAATLRGNVGDWYADRIDHATFRARQRETWDAIVAAGPIVHDAVLAILRDAR